MLGKSMKVSTVAGAHDKLLTELQRLLLHKESSTKDAKKLEERLLALRLGPRQRSSAKQVEEALNKTIEVLRCIWPKGPLQYDLRPPPVATKRPSVGNRLVNASATIVGKLPIERLTGVNLSHTILATKERRFDSGGGRAIPLCYPDDCQWDSSSNRCKKIKDATRSRLIINNQALEIIKAIRGPVCVVTIVGPCRTGKSYILSQLISSSGDRSCFQLGHKMDPETMGIWMWDTPFEYRLKNGKQVTMILLDTEGIDAYNASDRADNQIFTLSVLLSSLMIYNSVAVPRREDLQNMHFVANLAQSISGKGRQKLKKAEANQIAPVFLWLLRDVILEPTDRKGKPCHVREFLLQKVLHQDDSDDFEETVQTKASRCLLEFFRSFDAEMLPPPSSNAHVMKNIEDPRFQAEISSNFLQQVEYVRRKILDKCEPKRGYTAGSSVTGIQFAEMVREYVEALNSPTGIPEVGSTWDRVVKTTYETGLSKALAHYQQSMQTLVLPVELNDLLGTHSNAYSTALDQFERDTQLDSDQSLHTQYFTSLQNKLATYTMATGECDGGILHDYMQKNHAASEMQCGAQLKSLKESLLMPLLNNLSAQTDFDTIIEAIAEIQRRYRRSGKGPAKQKVLQEFLKELEKDRIRYEGTLKTLKNYEAKKQKQMQQIQYQELQHEQQLEAKRRLAAELQQSKLDNKKKLEKLESKMKTREQKLREERQRQEYQHEKQIQALQYANMEIETELQERRDSYEESVEVYEEAIEEIRRTARKNENMYLSLRRQVEDYQRQLTAAQASACSLM